MLEGNKSSGNLSRRDLLKLLGIGTVVGGTIGTAAGAAFARILNDSAASLDLNSIPHPVSDYLKQTQTVMESKGVQTSFVEGFGFSKEMFESVRRGTFIIEMLDMKANEMHTGTAWLAKKDDEDMYVVTCNHVIPPGKTDEVRLCRPGVDNSVFSSSDSSVAYSGRDVAVLKIKGNYPGIVPLEAMGFEDGIVLKPESEIMVVGFPGEFINFDKLWTSHVMGTVIDTSKDFMQVDDGSLIFKAAANYGASGSPSVINHNGTLKVIGMLDQRNDLVFPGDKSPSPAIYIEPLNVVPLINSLKNS